MKYYTEAYSILDTMKEREDRQRFIAVVFPKKKLTEILENFGNVLLGAEVWGPGLPFQIGEKYEYVKFFYRSERYMLGACIDGDGEIKLITLGKTGAISFDEMKYFLENR